MDLRDTRSFKIKKWTLFGICLVYMLLNILLMLISGSVADFYVDVYEDTQTQSSISSGIDTIPKDKEEVNPQSLKDIVKITIIVGAFLAILVDLIGLIGAYKEHLCLTRTFAIILSIGTFFSIVSFLVTFKNFMWCVINIAVTVLAYAFARDIKMSQTQIESFNFAF